MVKEGGWGGGGGGCVKRRVLYRSGAAYSCSLRYFNHRAPKWDLRETPVLIATVEPRYVTKGQGTGKICSL